MQDFNEYAKNADNFKTAGAGGFNGDLFKTVTETAKNTALYLAIKKVKNHNL